MLIKLGRRAQTTAEYAILFGLVVGGLLAMQVYIRRGLQGRIKDVVDHTGSGGEVAGAQLQFSGGQYEPYYLTSNTASSQNSSENESVQAGGSVTKTSNTGSEATRNTTLGWGNDSQE